jgi:hypothetical protein
VKAQARPARIGHRRKRLDLIGILEAAYRVEQAEQSWLTGILDAAASGLDVGLGALAFSYNAASPSEFGFRCVVTRNAPSTMLEVMNSAARALPTELVTNSFWTRRASTIREMPGWASFYRLPLQFDAEHVANDAIGINGLDPSRVGCQIGAYSDHEIQLSPRMRAAWDRVSTHLAAAFRLQRALQAAKEHTAPTEAVLAPSGRVLHAERPAQDRSVRDALSEACQTIERARTRQGRLEGEISLSLWRSLVSERWTLGYLRT